MAGIIYMPEMISLALHSMVMIANNENGTVTVKDIAKRAEYSEAHLAKVLQRLVKAGFLKSLRGPKGGFSLALEPEKITLLEIYNAVEGVTNFTGCPTNRSRCPFQKCIFGDVLNNLNKQFIDYLESHSLKDFHNYL